MQPRSAHNSTCKSTRKFLAGRAARIFGFVGLAAALAAPAATPARADPGEAFAAYTAGSRLTVDHSAFDRILKTYVVESPDGINRFAYGRLKREAAKDLGAYIARLEATDTKALDRPEQFAFWANLYNAKTLDIVTARYPVRSIKDISLGGGLVALVTGGPWKAKVLRVGGVDLSLDDIEHSILRGNFKDPRVHYSVNCASLGCPNLMRSAFTGATLEAQLDAGARAYVNHPRGIRIDGGKVHASSIYDWFSGDFGGTSAGVVDHVRRYAGPALKRKLEGMSEIADYGYDWSLNDAR